MSSIDKFDISRYRLTAYFQQIFGKKTEAGGAGVYFSVIALGFKHILNDPKLTGQNLHIKIIIPTEVHS